MIKLKSILNEIEDSTKIVKIDGIPFKHIRGKSTRGIDSYYVPTDMNIFSEYIKNKFIDVCGYRSIEAKYGFKTNNNEYVNDLIIQPMEDFNQSSVDTNSFYYSLMDNLDNWKTINGIRNDHYRSASVKFSNDENIVRTEYMPASTTFAYKLYEVYPSKDSTVLCSMYKDSFLYLPHLFKIVDERDFVDVINKIVNFISSIILSMGDYSSIEINDLQSSNNALEYLYKNEFTPQHLRIFKNSTSLIRKYDDLTKYMINKCNSNPITLLEDLFDPEKNGIKLLKATSSELREILTNTNTSNEFDGYELWTSDMCYCKKIS